MKSPGLTVTDASQAPLDPDAQLTLGGSATEDDDRLTATALWDDLFDPWATRFPGAVLESIQNIARGKTLAEFYDALDVGDCLDGLIETVCRAIVLGGERDERAVWNALDTLGSVGRGAVMGVNSTVGDIETVCRILAHDEADVIPTVAITLPREFAEIESQGTRTNIARVLGALAEGCDLRLIAPPSVQLKLFREHREEIPKISDAVNSPLTGGTPSADAAREAFEALGSTGQKTAIVEFIGEAGSDVRSYHELDSHFDLNTSRRSQILSSDSDALTKLGLVRTFGKRGSKKVELTDAGREYLEIVENDRDAQWSLVEFSEPGKPSHDTRVTPDAHGDPTPPADTAADRNRLARWHKVSYLSRSEHIAAAGSVPKQGVAVVNYPIKPRADRGEAGWSWDEEAEKLVVSAEGQESLPFMVCLARSLADSKTLDRVLTEERLSEGMVADFIAEHKATLWGSRCLGYLPADIEDGADYVDAIAEARDELLNLTREFAQAKENGETDKKDRLARTILREAHGLHGTMSHLLDLAGVDIVREVRFPTFSQHMPDERRDARLQTISKAATIASKYGQSALYRHLFEPREDKRHDAISPTVDAADPYGELLGSWVLVGDIGSTERYHDLIDATRKAFRAPSLVHEDAPEIAVRVPVVDGCSRRAFSEAVRDVCETKDLKATREAVSLFHSLCRSPYDATRALMQLGADNDGREIRPSEIRYALTHVPADRLLRGVSSTPRKVVAALLRTDEPLSAPKLAEAADVSRRSLRDHLDGLAGTDLVRETSDGYRIALSRPDSEERYTDILPSYSRGVSGHPTRHKAGQALRLYDEWVAPGVDDPPESKFEQAVDIRRLVDATAWREDILPALWAIAETDHYADRAPQRAVRTGYLADDDALTAQSTAVEFGTTPQQAALPNAAAASGGTIA